MYEQVNKIPQNFNLKLIDSNEICFNWVIRKRSIAKDSFWGLEGLNFYIYTLC